MPWVRFDDQFPEHRKVVGLSDAAFRLHVSAICWSARHLTDGVVPAAELDTVVRMRKPRRFVTELVARKLWVETDEGWLINDYLTYQPSREKVLADREQKAKAGRQGGLRSGQSRRSKARGSKPEADAKQPGSFRLNTRTRPPSFFEGGEGDVTASTRPEPHGYEPMDYGCFHCPLPEQHWVHKHLKAVGEQ